MRLTDLLALSHVPRWGIVPRQREQYVSDHCFRVAVIANELMRRTASKLSAAGWQYALFHDASECRSGDLPAPFKESISDMEPVIERKVSWTKLLEKPTEWETAIIGIADQVEAFTWISKNRICGPHSARAMDGIRAAIAKESHKMGIYEDVSAVMSAILAEEGR